MTKLTTWPVVGRPSRWRKLGHPNLAWKIPMPMAAAILRTNQVAMRRSPALNLRRSDSHANPKALVIATHVGIIHSMKRYQPIARLGGRFSFIGNRSRNPSSVALIKRDQHPHPFNENPVDAHKVKTTANHTAGTSKTCHKTKTTILGTTFDWGSSGGICRCWQFKRA
jgi:hypothetical protein